MSQTRIYWLHTLSPTHVGVGRGMGYIDLPIDRDGITNWPIIRASAFKGVWADYFKANEENRKNDPHLRAAFGISGAENDSNSGSLIPTDAKLVCLPVRSFRGTFAWVTSPLCLQMVRRTLELSGAQQLPEAPAKLEDGKAHYADAADSALKDDAGNIYLEDLDFKAQACDTVKAWAEKIATWVFTNDTAWQTEFKKRFVVIPNDAFDFLCETGTEVHTRVKIEDETKVVAEGALWTEESLPAESFLMGIIQCERVFQKEANGIKPDELVTRFATDRLHLQMGGKATVGRGQVHCSFTQVKGA